MLANYSPKFQTDTSAIPPLMAINMTKRG